MKHCLRILLACAMAAGCTGREARDSGGDRPRRGSVRVAAASDLNAALGEVITRFSAAHPIDVSVSYGSSGNFFAQLLNGAPFDLFLSADVAYPRQLAERGLTLEHSEFLYAIGRLVLWTPGSSPLDPQHDGLRLLTSAAARKIAIANPEHAPYGRAAVAALQDAGIYDAVKPKLVYGENVAQTLQFAQSGAADAALVALSLALAPNARNDGHWVELATSSYPRIEQGGVILKSAADVESARALRDYIAGPEGRAILQQYGFSIPSHHRR